MITPDHITARECGLFIYSMFAANDLNLRLAMLSLILAAFWLCCIETIAARSLGPQGVNIWRLNADLQRHAVWTKSTKRPDTRLRPNRQQTSFDHEPSVESVSKKTYDFRPQWFEQPLDHFDQSSKHRFRQRYWVNSRHYKSRRGAPVIVLDGGETNGEVCCVSPLRIAPSNSFFTGSPSLLGHRHC